MITKKDIQKCFRSLMMHRLRTFLSTLGVLFGVTAVIAMLSIGEGAKQETLEQIEQLGMNSLIIRQNLLTNDQQVEAIKRRSLGLTWEDALALEKNIPYLNHPAVPIKIVKASLMGTKTPMTPEILATTQAFGTMKNLETSEGRFLSSRDHQQRALVCVLGYEIAKSLGIDGHLGSVVRIENIHFQVVGVLKPTYWKASKNSSISSRNLDQTIFVPLGAERSLPQNNFLDKDQLSEIILQIKDPQWMDYTAKIAQKMLKKSHHDFVDYQIIIPQELLNQATKTQETFNLVLGSIAAISLLVGGIGIMNIMLATVSERTREIGIRRAVGANQRHIMIQFLLETLLLTLSGAILGVIVGIIFSLFISYLADWKTIVTFWSVLLSLTMASLVGLFSGLYPAYKAAIMDPIKALHHN